MKKVTLLFVSILVSVLAYAQHSVSEISDIQKDCLRILEQYDMDDAMDSIAIQLDAYISSSEKTYARARTAEAAAEVAIWRCFRADLWSYYYRSNRFRICSRTEVDDTLSSDIKTWSGETFQTRILQEYELSLHDAPVWQTLKAKDYSSLFDAESKQSYFPTLYDLVVYHIIARLQNMNKSYVSLENLLNKPEYFEKIMPPIVPSSPRSLDDRKLRLFQQLQEFHQNDANKEALHYSLLQRYDFLFQNSELPEKDSLYLNALLSLASDAGTMGIVSQSICASLGAFYEKRADEAFHEVTDDYLTAIDWYEKALRAAPASSCTEMIQDGINKIKEKRVSFTMSDMCYPEPQLVQFNSVNCDTVYYLIAKKSEKMRLPSVDEIIHLDVLSNAMVPVRSCGKHFTDTTVLRIPALKPGAYVMLVSVSPFSNPAKIPFEEYQACAEGEFKVTKLTCLYEAHDGHFFCYVRDKKSGEAIVGAKVSMTACDSYRRGATQHRASALTDENGRADIPLSKFPNVDDLFDGWFSIVISSQDDQIEAKAYAYELENCLVLNTYSEESKAHAALELDRVIYRPGQTLHWKAIVEERNGNQFSLITTGEVEIRLVASNGDLVAKDTVTLNDFGSAAGTFLLPENGCLGEYWISAWYHGNRIASRILRVEAYKRPTFEVTINQPKGVYKIGEKVEVNGNVSAYAGYPIQDANVQYIVTRTCYFPFKNWRNNPYAGDMYSETTVSQGTIQTDETGTFTIDFVAVGEPYHIEYLPMYKYEIELVVSDPSGESHEATSEVYASSRSLKFNLDIPTTIHADTSSNQFLLQALNVVNVPQQVNVHYSIYQLEEPSHFLISSPIRGDHVAERFGADYPYFAFHSEDEPSNWTEHARVDTGSLTTSATSTDANFSIHRLSQLPTGAYRIHYYATDDFGNQIEESEVFYIAQKKNDFTEFSALSIERSANHVKAGETVSFSVGSYFDNQEVLVKLLMNDSLVEERWVRLDKNSYTLTKTLGKEDVGNLSCQAYAFRENKYYTAVKTISVSDAKHDLAIELVTFRDKLQPGEKENVKLVIRDPEGKRMTNAEMVCTMYDASLDAFASNVMDDHLFQRYFDYAHTLHPSYVGYFADHYDASGLFYPKECRGTFPQWKSLIGIFDDFIPSYRMYNKANRESLMDCELHELSDVYLVPDALEGMEVLQLAYTTTGASVYEADDAGEPSPSEVNEVKVIPNVSVTLRSDFSETAFFYPFLRTNENGEIEMEFTVPDALTKWKMMGFSHSKDVRCGQFVKYLQTQKEVMVVPNAPRFVYEGDEWRFAAKVVNQGTKTMQGEVTLTILNTETEEIVAQRKESVSLAANSTVPVNFDVEVPFSASALTYRIVVRAQDGNDIFSDGEEKMVPVLSRRMIMTETLPLFITKKGTKTFSLKNLPALGKDIVSCKLQFTPDPKWNAVLALPYLMEYPYDCNEQLFSKLYANTMAEYICQQNPNFKTLLDQVAAEHPEALRSKLEQNQELKQILLEETPWVRDAQDEDNDIQNIICLFDTKNVDAERKSMVNKLTSNQNPDGGWHWFSKDARYPSDSYITEHILIGSGRLLEMNVCKAGDNFLGNNVLRDAVGFIDHDMERVYKQMKKNNPDYAKVNQLNSGVIHYLYARSFYLDMKKPSTEAYDFYYGQLVKYADKMEDMYMVTMAALTLYQSGNKEHQKIAADLMSQVKSKAIHSEEMGMYWKKRGNGYYWTDALIERQALMIEAFDKILKDEESVKEMKIWLLQQKRTQHWNTTRSTVDACFALLTDRNEGVSSHLQNPPATISVSLCDKKLVFVDTLQIPVKQDVSACIENGLKGTVELQRDNDGLSYGGVFVQYYQDIDQVASTGTDIPLSVERKLYRVEQGRDGEVLVPLSANAPLKVGDKVRVRMELRCDREMEYVHLKDLRAAAFEPVTTLSGYHRQDGLLYYQSVRDASVNFFFSHVYKGTYVFEYSLLVTQTGTYSSGYASIQCMYAPEFCAHSAGSGKITVR